MFYMVLLFKSLLVIVHGVFTAFELAREFWDYYLKKLIYLLEHAATKNDFEFIIKNLHHFKKTPQHVTVLLNEEAPSCADLANFLLWCMVSGVSFVSFYDHTGRLKEVEDELQQLIKQRVPKGQHIIWHKNNTYKNSVTGRTIHVKVLSVNDGRDSIVKVAKNLIKSEEVNIDCINSSLHSQYEFPDPELGLYCGKALRLYGYPPWQIRVTEFFGIKSHHNIKVYTFVDMLKKFNKCEQRYGE